MSEALYIKTSHLFIIFPTLLTATIVACFAVSIYRGDVDGRVFTISIALQHDPARAIATFGLPLAGACVYLLILARILNETGGTSSERLLGAANSLALLCALGFLGVAACTPVYNLIAHSIFAALLFASEGVALILLLVDDYYAVYKSWNNLLTLRLSLLFLGVGLLACMGFGQLYNVFIASIAEILFTAVSVICLVSYATELSSFSLKVRLIKT
jgi:hypothetical protein